MKNRLTTLDIACLIFDLRQKLVGLRVDQIYDIDKKTYLIRLVKSGGVKKVLLLESGTRFHTTQFDYTKNPAPSGFSMKLRKHLNNKRLEKIEQVGADRIVQFQFGTDVAAYYLFLELYDKGNIILTDNKYTILNLVRPRIIGEERLAAHEIYAIEGAKQSFSLDKSQIEEILRNNPKGSLREVFLSKLEFGPPLFAHVLKEVGLLPQAKVDQLIRTEEDLVSSLDKIFNAFEKGRVILENITDARGFIVQTKQDDPAVAPVGGDLSSAAAKPQFYDQFHPSALVNSFENIIEFESFDEAVDEFFSKMESQKSDMRQLSKEKEAIKKLEKVKTDQHRRLKELQDGQEVDKKKAELITINQTTVDAAISTIRKLVANQISWDTIQEQIQEARSVGDPLASMISKLNLKHNSVTLSLVNLYDPEQPAMDIDVDLNLSAFANASKYFDLKKATARKEEKALEFQGKVLKSTEKKTMASLKEAATIHSIKKARKVMWFEKFKWFITSENFLVIGGRDAQQNEMLVKKYMRSRDVYMHADAHGAPTLIIKNDNQSEEIPPKSLNECGVYAISCSGSWESKVVTSSWWVWGDQVSKSAQSGEYLPTGSFMIRGKKNYLPPCQLVLGFAFLFRLSEESIEAHKNERPRRSGNEIQDSQPQQQQEIEIDESDDDLDEEFPDTHVNLNVEGDKVRTRLLSTASGGQERGNDDEETEFFVTAAPATAINNSVQKLKNKQKKNAKFLKSQLPISKNVDGKNKGQKPPVSSTPESNAADVAEMNRPKRGQHGRKKKLKEKYKFQDDEERLLRMQLLRVGQADILESVENKNQNDESNSSDEENPGKLKNPTEEAKPQKKEKNAEEPTKTAENASETVKTENDEDEQQEEEESRESELDLLKALTSVPLEQDEILYAIPVVAPYATLQNYKFRIKMIPGTTKRGKAAKMALESFLRDKEATTREKDLIKAVKDQDIARNIPGKVKLSNIIRDKK